MILIILLTTHDEFMHVNPEVAVSPSKNSEHMILRKLSSAYYHHWQRYMSDDVKNA